MAEAQAIAAGSGKKSIFKSPVFWIVAVVVVAGAVTLILYFKKKAKKKQVESQTPPMPGTQGYSSYGQPPYPDAGQNPGYYGAASTVPPSMNTTGNYPTAQPPYYQSPPPAQTSGLPTTINPSTFMQAPLPPVIPPATGGPTVGNHGLILGQAYNWRSFGAAPNPGTANMNRVPQTTNPYNQRNTQSAPPPRF